jgi:hypothetical protein
MLPHQEMKKQHDERYEGDNTPSREIARKYREVIHEDDHNQSLALIHYRGGEEEFRIGKEYCFSGDPGDRATGADIIAQLGWGAQTFRDESIEILTRLLDDSDAHVVSSAAAALGHRSAESAIPAFSDSPITLMRRFDTALHLVCLAMKIPVRLKD